MGEETCVIENAFCGATEFRATHPSSYWIVYGAVMTAIVMWSYHNLHFKGVTMRHLGMLGAGLSLFGFVPFFIALVSGLSMTGLRLTPSQAVRIYSRHAILMIIWFVLSLVQVFSYLIKKQKIHNAVGKIVMYYLLPLIFFELNFNASWVFLPDKPSLLYRALHGITDDDAQVPWSIIFQYCWPFVYALFTTLTMMMYWYLSHLSLKKGQIRMHVTYMVMYMQVSIGAGLYRWTLKGGFAATQCKANANPLTAIMVQCVLLNYQAIMNFVPLMFMYGSLPLQTRLKDPMVKLSFYYYFAHFIVNVVACAVLDVPTWFTCAAIES